MFQYLPKNKHIVRWIMNIWPPFLFSGIGVTELSDDFRYCKVRLKNWAATRNVNGAQYGGSLFAMTDPIYAMMLILLLGDKYYIWDKEAEIEFKKPGIGKIFLECSITDKMLQEIYEHTRNGDKYFPKITSNLYDETGDTIATTTRTLYVRLKPKYRPSD
ncbi:MAG: DUF4442 domain-containing protein [Neisseriaceae bacterium]|nr:MAG: DUF4442 domain-containing protein [Neisseriaceae bacterium]